MTAENIAIIENEEKQFNEIAGYSYDKYIDFAKQLIEHHPLSYFSLLSGNRYRDTLWKDICEKTSFLDEHFKPSAATRAYYYINKLACIRTCDTCGKIFAKNISPVKAPSYFFCCNRCAQKHESTVAKTKATKLKNHGDPNYNNMEKTRETCMKHYGVECSWQAEEVKQKSKQSIREHFGVDHHMRSDEVKEGMKARYKAKHGVEHAFQDPNVQAKIHAKNQKNYGVDYPMQSKKLHKIMHEHSALTQTTNFFNNKLSKDPQYEALFTLDEWLKYGRSDNSHEYLWKCKKCGKTFKSRIMWGAATYVRCYDCFPVMKDTSNFEKDVASFVRSLGKYEVLNHTYKTKQVISPKEIDVIVKDMSGKIILGVEADGLYWHSAANQHDMWYHLSKTDACNSKSIQLVHMFEDEWKLKNDITKSRLASILGVFKERVYARKCEVRVVRTPDARKFFDKNHLQGYCSSKIVLGLWHSNEYVAMMSFGKRRKIMNGKDEDNSWELLRFACKCWTNVVGGASKLLSHFETDFKPKKLVSYADRRWSIGKVYEVLGFKLDHISAPSYWYLDSSFSKRIYRYAFTKSKQRRLLPNFDENKTEMENMAANGYSWIWDCGNYVYVKTYEQ